MLEVLLEHYKHKTIFQRMKLLLEFVTISVDPKLDAEQQVDVFREYSRVLSRAPEAGGFGSSITIDDLMVCIFLLTLSPQQ